MESPYKGKTGPQRIWNAFFYSLDGLAAAFRHEDAFRQEILLALVLIPAAFYMPAGGTGKGLMVASVLLVLITELLNSAIEAVTDRVSLEDHRLAKRSKNRAALLVTHIGSATQARLKTDLKEFSCPLRRTLRCLPPNTIYQLSTVEPISSDNS